MCPALCAVIIFEMRSCFSPKPTWTTILLFYISCHHWYDKHMSLCPALSRDGVSQTLMQGDLEQKFSQSQPPVARITGICHWNLATLLSCLVLDSSWYISMAHSLAHLLNSHRFIHLTKPQLGLNSLPTIVFWPEQWVMAIEKPMHFTLKYITTNLK
jgi:hypothetical protein